MTPLIPRFIICSLAVSLFAGGALLPPALAQGQPTQQASPADIFVDLGRWVIVQDETARRCELRLTSNPDVVLRYVKPAGRPAILVLQKRSGQFFTGMVGDIDWTFDNVRFGGYLSGDGYRLSSDSSEVTAEFRSAETLTVTHGGLQVARLSLKTSSAGYRLLEQCSEQWRFARPNRSIAGTIDRSPDRSVAARIEANRQARLNQSAARQATPAAPASPASIAPAPTLTTPLRPRPISPATWIRADDRLPWPRRGWREGEGTLRYSLLINQEGRAEQCEVRSSTGSRQVDQRACELLIQRARFEPARNAQGAAVDARYSSSVRFAVE